MSEAGIVSIVCAVLGSGLLSTLVSYIFSRLDKRKAKKDGVREGVRIMLYDRIKHLGKTYIARGSVTPEELEDIVNMHNIYHNELGGNGFLDSVMDKVKKLPIKEELAS